MNGSTTLPSQAAQKDYPAILGVSAAAGTDEVKRQYRLLARKHHPDQGGDPKKFQEITEAYEVLTDPGKKALWEQLREERAAPSWERWERQHMGERFDGDILNLYQRIWHIQEPSRIGELHLDALQAAEGHTATITINGAAREVQIPAGIADQTELLLDGNKVLTIRVHPHHTYKVDGDDLEVTVPVGYPELVLGAELEVPTPDGGAKIRIQPGTQPSTRVRISGKGVRRNGHRGDLYVQLQLQVPKQIPPEAQTHLEAYMAHVPNPTQERSSRTKSSIR